MKKAMAVGLIIGAMLIGVTLFAGSSSVKRNVKSLTSDLGGGLERTVTLYDYTGKEIERWTGKFDVSESENEVYFDVDGKRVIIHGGIVVNEEK